MEKEQCFNNQNYSSKRSWLEKPFYGADMFRKYNILKSDWLRPLFCSVFRFRHFLYLEKLQSDFMKEPFIRFPFIFPFQRTIVNFFWNLNIVCYLSPPET